MGAIHKCELRRCVAYPRKESPELRGFRLAAVGRLSDAQFVARTDKTRGAQTRVLVIDDHDDSRGVCVTALARAGFEVFDAQGGAHGLELARSVKPAIILLDLMMPDMNGWEVATELHADEATRNIPLIAITACAEGVEVARALKLGCSGFIEKPAEPARIVATALRLARPE